MSDKPKPENSGLDWSELENALIVADYFGMLEDELAGREYNKAARGRALMKAGVKRSLGSIDRKRMNVSAVLHDLLCVATIKGFKRLPNYQQSLLTAVERHLVDVGIDRYDRMIGQLSSESIKSFDLSSIFVDVPIVNKPNRDPDRHVTRLVRKFDPVERDHRNRVLGHAGEQFVVDVETAVLRHRGRPDLAESVRWVSDRDGDGAGYDILSFDENGEKREIEVKTTRGGIATPFFLTPNELDVSRELESWRLYRVHDFGDRSRIYTVAPPLDGRLALSAALWQAVPN